MKSAHIPRPLFIVIFIFLLVAFFTGTLRLFRSAEAAVYSQPASLAGSAVSSAELSLVVAAAPTPAPTPTPASVSADTAGIIALTIVIVTTILLGAAWGVRRSHPK